MFGLFEPLDNIRGFLESGGYVLWLIFFVSLCLWMLIIERYWYLRMEHPKVVKSVLEQWQQRSDTSSWYAQRIRDAKISQIWLKLSRSLAFIRTLVAVCPLLGLLGTVTGMIHVFDVMDWNDRNLSVHHIIWYR